MELCITMLQTGDSGTTERARARALLSRARYFGLSALRQLSTVWLTLLELSSSKLSELQAQERRQAQELKRMRNTSSYSQSVSTISQTTDNVCRHDARFVSCSSSA
jgi:hypothetical protein